MRSTLDPLTDDRWDGLVAELRATRPVPPPALRERVLEAAARPLPVRRPGRLRVRFLVPALAIALVAVAGVVGVRTQGVGSGAADRAPEMTLVAPEPASADELFSPSVIGDAGEAARDPAPFAPVPTARLQEQRVALGVRVPDVDALAEATARAMEAVRSLGGFVVAARYEVPSPDGGDSTLVVRVPTARVQEAIARLTGLGTIVSQDVQLQDLQPAYDRRDRELEGLRERIARAEEQLAAPGLAEDERARLRAQLAQLRRAVQTRQAQQRAAEQQGRLARVELALTTRSEQVAPPAPDDGAGAILRAAAELVGAMLVWTAAGLIVAGPFLVLAALAAAAARTRRRFLQARLLERS